MASFPHLPLFTDAYLTDTMGLTSSEHGVYLVMLMLAWRRPDCRLPSDRGELKRMLSCVCSDMHGNRFNRAVPGLLERFFTRTEDGDFEQKRLRKERDFVTKRSRSASENAKKRRPQSNKVNELAPADTVHARVPIPIPIPSKQERISDPSGSSPPWPAVQEGSLSPTKLWPPVTKLPKDGRGFRYPEEFERFWGAYPRARLDSKSKAYSAWRSAILVDQQRPDDLLQAAERYEIELSRPSSPPPKHVQTWINARGWECEYQGRANGPRDDRNCDLATKLAREISLENGFDPDLNAAS